MSASLPKWICDNHKSKGRLIEAYCEECLRALCIECIVTNKHRGHEILGLAEATSKSTSQFTTYVESQVDPTAKMVSNELEDLKQVEVLLETQRESYTT